MRGGNFHHRPDDALADRGGFQFDKLIRRQVERLVLAMNLREDDFVADPRFSQPHDVFDRHASMGFDLIRRPRL